MALVLPEDIEFLGAIYAFGATLAFVIVHLSVLVLRRREPDLDRPYRTPGGTLTTGVAFVLACTAVVATFFVDEEAAGITAGVFLLAIAYFWFYSRHRLVADAPEEEFEAIERAEAELAGGG
jgi:ethanolamine permease